ncbi:hypothetical protein [Tenggerimyces flavus]|uniref:Uncharacterized protein n=1 Tax=Tenggerimyces flavus TaxID=1708749 RepID=A0ABV7YB90_9ACTN|nr:hypothetical protein [Tenggerimyces flavus]MBM7787075.1 hypothetical protein [Tenggerimyces flavus]
MPTRKLLYRRRFLNRPRHHTGAHVIARVELVQYKKSPWYVDSSLRLADCYRVIELDFEIRNKTDVKNALHKAKLLRDLLDDFTKSLEDAVEQWENKR